MIKLDSLLFGDYVDRQSIPIINAIRKAFLSGQVNWAKCGKPKEIRACIWDILQRVLSAHAKVNAVSRLLLERAMFAIVDNVADAVMSSVKAIPKFDLGGMLKAMVEIECIHQTLIHFVSEKSKSTFSTSYTIGMSEAL